MKLNMETPSNIEPYIGTSEQDWESRFETICPHGTILYVAVDDICVMIFLKIMLIFSGLGEPGGGRGGTSTPTTRYFSKVFLKQL